MCGASEGRGSAAALVRAWLGEALDARCGLEGQCGVAEALKVFVRLGGDREAGAAARCGEGGIGCCCCGGVSLLLLLLVLLLARLHDLLVFAEGIRPVVTVPLAGEEPALHGVACALCTIVALLLRGLLRVDAAELILQEVVLARDHDVAEVLQLILSEALEVEAVAVLGGEELLHTLWEGLRLHRRRVAAAVGSAAGGGHGGGGSGSGGSCAVAGDGGGVTHAAAAAGPRGRWAGQRRLVRRAALRCVDRGGGLFCAAVGGPWCRPRSGAVGLAARCAGHRLCRSAVGGELRWLHRERPPPR
ncbi:hypothetical protein NESM_000591800 [Novymonas esmeraldas]|uniref:Uncharacterized protein n=1 Tax=Novymonas esmeraldas TaxID=1808958 RepID=A0AAW0ES48_9TRYP